MFRITTLAYLFIFLSAIALGNNVQSQETRVDKRPPLTRLLRFPDIHEDTVSFVFAGDIYLAKTSGGSATRLTSHVGLELFPKFSPDGTKIAFSAEYSGSRQVYVINRDGSDLRQLSYYNDIGKMPPRGGFDYRVLDWAPDGKHILVRANRLPWSARIGRPMLIPLRGGLAKEMPIPEGGAGMFSPDGSQLVYTPMDREWRTWKRHRGGRAQDVWIYDLVNNKSQQLTNNRATDHQPLWIDNTIYFISDRNYTLNLYQIVPGSQPKQLTFHKDFDVLWPSAGPTAAVYQSGGFLYHFNPKTASSQKIPIIIGGDRPLRRAKFKNVSAYIDSFDLSPEGNRALLTARGELFTVPASSGPIRNISLSPASREISASWSPDGTQLLYLSDSTGEYEIYIRSQDGKGEAKQLTRNSNIWKFPPVWAGSSDRFAWSDKNNKLWVMSVRGNRKEIDRAIYDAIDHYRFSKDGRYLTYTKTAANGFSQIWIYDNKSGKKYLISDSTSSDYSPVFDPQNRYLYFLSKRDYNLSFSSYEFNYLYQNATRVYAYPLSPSIQMPGRLSSSEAEVTQTKNNPENASKHRIKIDPENMRKRAVALNEKGGNYENLSANSEGALAISSTGKKKSLILFKVAKIISTDLVAKDIEDYRLSHNGKKILAKKDKVFAIVDAKKKQNIKKQKLDLTQLETRIEPPQEFAQLYRDAWRILRDFFYDPNMHGQDWEKIYDKYRPLVDHVAHRSDLDFILGEMAGELNAGHIYVQSGDEPSITRVEGGLLGADIRSHNSGYFQITKIFKGENWHTGYRSPLTSASIEINEGDFILAVNGVSTKSTPNIYKLLENTNDKVITLSIASKPNPRSAKDALVVPINRETNLRYLDWVESRMAYVEKKSDGRIGYIHLPNTSTAGNRELFKQFLPQINKEALIIDDRYNGGGFIPDHMIALLARKPLNYWKRRGLEPSATPFYHHDGPKVMLVNGYSSSGGDALPYYFRKKGLGKIIGTRTWGGLIGISGNPKLADGGQVLASTFRFLDNEGNWAVENEGVAPDIEVIDLPELINAGIDPSIDRAVEELLKTLPKTPKSRISAPPAPTAF